MRAKMYSFATFFSFVILDCVQTTNSSQIQRDVTVIVVVCFFIEQAGLYSRGGALD